VNAARIAIICGVLLLFVMTTALFSSMPSEAEAPARGAHASQSR
jgi:hypothetical protein